MNMMIDDDDDDDVECDMSQVEILSEKLQQQNWICHWRFPHTCSYFNALQCSYKCNICHNIAQYMPQCKTCHNLIQATMQHIAQCYTCHNASQKKDEMIHHIAFKGDIVGLQCMHCNTWWDEKRQCSEDRNALLQCDEAWLEWRGRTSPSKCTVCCIEVHGRL